MHFDAQLNKFAILVHLYMLFRMQNEQPINDRFAF